MKERLYRSRRDRVIGGVASGLGEYLNIDPVLIRVAFVVIALLSGIGVLLYIILWIVIPENYAEGIYDSTDTNKSDSGDKSDTAEEDFTNKDPKEFYKEYKKSNNGRTIFGIILVGAGLIFLGDRLFPFFDFEDLFPLLLIGIGVALLVNSIKK